MKKAAPIERIMKRYKNEWLLIDLDQVDERTLKPKSGRLVGHSARKEDLFEVMRTARGRLYAVYSGPLLPAGFQAAF